MKDSVETLEKVVALLQRELAFKPPVWRNAQGQCVEAYCWMDPVNMTLEHTPWEFPPKWMFDVVSIVPNGVALVNGIDVPAGDIVVRWYDGAIKVYTLEQFKAEFTKV